MKADKETVTTISAFVSVVLICATAYGISATTKSREVPEILILKEFVVETYDRGPARVVEYFVNGHAMNAVFYENDDEEYARFMAYLTALGRVSNAARK